MQVEPNPVKACVESVLVSALETENMMSCFQTLLSISTCARTLEVNPKPQTPILKPYTEVGELHPSLSYTMEQAVAAKDQMGCVRAATPKWVQAANAAAVAAGARASS